MYNKCLIGKGCSQSSAFIKTPSSAYSNNCRQGGGSRIVR
uniref:Uncharacterized protein n=1 Tax=Myoviridae sp. ctwwN25 TaxID=2825209 RepID=A0A8S5PQW4_9CAUD|nr:MAG TPA: hypothetical protein [Myoviridae sp. ctwwN25]